MELSPKQQIVELIRKSEKILLLGHTKPGGDSLGSLLAFHRVLTELGKKVSVVVSAPVPSSLMFLPGISNVQNSLDGSKDLVLKINIENAEIGKILTNTDGKYLDIVITPEKGELKEEEVKVEKGKPKYDIIVVLDTPDVDKIDKVYDEHTDLFFETPVVNIDHHPGNEYFGTINLVDLTATSTAEILVAIFEAIGKNKLDEDTATLLLTGITADTASFKNTSTTPKTLTVAAQLLAAGGRQQEIIQNLYKMKKLKTLKLWGKVLTSVQKDSQFGIVWAKISNSDFSDSGASLEEAKEIMDEMLANTLNANVVLLIVETGVNSLSVFLRGTAGADISKTAQMFGGVVKDQSAQFEMKNASLVGGELKIMDEIRKSRAKELGIAGKLEPEKKIEKIMEREARENGEKEKPEEASEPSTEEINADASVETVEDQESNVETTADENVGPESEVQQKEGNAGEDVISRAIESLETAQSELGTEEKDLKKETSSSDDTKIENSETKVYYENKSSMTPISEILKKFSPEDKQKLDEFQKKNEEARKKLKRENGDK